MPKGFVERNAAQFIVVDVVGNEYCCSTQEARGLRWPNCGVIVVVVVVVVGVFDDVGNGTIPQGFVEQIAA